ncbi:MAG: flagellar brake protein [Proteobacteria bacterium]|nr:flagellar brake protein [Pseudomonadota bacterium]HQR02812.1 flagellar brake protein [Rhodocyclaceae bacterium]
MNDTAPTPPVIPAATTAGADPSLPAAQTLLEPADYDQYMLYSKHGILFVIRALIAQLSQMTVFFGDNLLLTAVIAVDETSIILDYGASMEVNRRVVEADKLFCVTSLEKVKIQFILRGLEKIEYEGRPAFRAALPDAVLRLQRREYYRLTMPITRPLVAVIRIPLKDGLLHEQAVNVADISGGGIAMVVPPEGMVLQPGMEFPDCSIDLPEIGMVSAPLRVCSVFELTLRSGVRLHRSGCQFVNLSPAMTTLIQRYIIKTERERKARESGLA